MARNSICRSSKSEVFYISFSNLLLKLFLLILLVHSNVVFISLGSGVINGIILTLLLAYHRGLSDVILPLSCFTSNLRRMTKNKKMSPFGVVSVGKCNRICGHIFYMAQIISRS